MASIKLFLKEATQELFYNIVYDVDEDEIEYRNLSKRSQKKTGHRPMDFFGLGNISDGGWFDFIRGIPGIVNNNNSGSDDEDSEDDDDDDGYVYRVFNRTEFNKGSIAEYRGMILIRCCKIISKHFHHLSYCKDEHSNTPLHFIAALPSVSEDCGTLVKY